MLPDGWTYDEVSNSFVLGETQDFWSVEEGFLARNHVIARDSSWRPTPDAIKDVPIKLGDLQALKITMREGAVTMMVDSVSVAERKIQQRCLLWKNVVSTHQRSRSQAQDAIRKSQKEDQ